MVAPSSPPLNHKFPAVQPIEQVIDELEALGEEVGELAARGDSEDEEGPPHRSGGESMEKNWAPSVMPPISVEGGGAFVNNGGGMCFRRVIFSEGVQIYANSPGTRRVRNPNLDRNQRGQIRRPVEHREVHREGRQCMDPYVE